MEEIECIFCKIIKKEIPSYVVFEDEKCIAFLDIRPVTKGMIILVPRFHYENFDFDIETSLHCFKKSVEISKTIKDVLNSIDVVIANIRSPFKHFNIRIYPISNENENPLIQNKPIEINEPELNQIWQRILGIKTEIKEKIETKKIKEERKKEEKDIETLIKKWEKKFLP